MPIKFTCECGKEITVRDEYTGKHGTCPACGSRVTVPYQDIPHGSMDSDLLPDIEDHSVVRDEIVWDQKQIEPEGQSGKTLIDKVREDYQAAMNAIDLEVKTLIDHGKETKALFRLSEAVGTIIEIREMLGNFYNVFYCQQDALKRFGSQRLKQLGHKLIPICKSFGEHESDTKETEQSVVFELRDLGIAKKHWYLKEVVVSEIEYMLDVLQILIEPEFIPLESTSESEDTKLDRYIPSAVKLAVWRRDCGKCVQCGSQEKLEYDHTIPVSKGGSNTERNIQLLCEKCNREKSARIA